LYEISLIEPIEITFIASLSLVFSAKASVAELMLLLSLRYFSLATKRRPTRSPVDWRQKGDALVIQIIELRQGRVISAAVRDRSVGTAQSCRR